MKKSRRHVIAIAYASTTFFGEIIGVQGEEMKQFANIFINMNRSAIRLG